MSIDDDFSNEDSESEFSNYNDTESTDSEQGDTHHVNNTKTSTDLNLPSDDRIKDGNGFWTTTTFNPQTASISFVPDNNTGKDGLTPYDGSLDNFANSNPYAILENFQDDRFGDNTKRTMMQGPSVSLNEIPTFSQQTCNL